ncbi:hypothetical protein [Psychrobacter aestuarii]|uniref:Uncharacterized protein n=1 Tax=Psychrobacter aestuarii TaxID=556327 RepID=A0ABP3F872_9GAMM|nr:hypothetical protein [Psychrobacter aestuarii]
MQKMTKLVKVSGLLLVLCAGSAQAESAPRAAMSDYVWEVLPQPEYPYEAYVKCNELDMEYNAAGESDYDACMYEIAEARDNGLSKEWGLSETLAREKDTIYIKVPNRRLPLTFREQKSRNEEEGSQLRLEAYDADAQIVTIREDWFEDSHAVFVNLKTGLNQELAGVQPAFSPSRKYVATVSDYPGGIDINIAKKQASGYYDIEREDENSTDVTEAHIAFYNGADAYKHASRVNLEWVTDSSLLVDYYYTINYDDNAAYRVRFNYVKPEGSDEWRVVPIR